MDFIPNTAPTTTRAEIMLWVFSPPSLQTLKTQFRLLNENECFDDILRD